MTLPAIRTIVAAAGMLAVARVAKVSIDRGSLRLGALLSFTNLAGPFILITLALEQASAGFVYLIIAVNPILMALMAHVLLADEPLHLRKLAGLLVAFGGVAYLLASGDSGLGSEGDPLLAFTLTILASVLMSFSSVLSRLRAGDYEPIALTTAMFVIGTPMLVMLAVAMDGLPRDITVAGWGLLTYLGIAGSVAPFLLLYWLLQRVTTARASLVGYLVPLVAALGGVIFLDERLEPGIVIGGALILLGVFTTDRFAGATRARIGTPGPTAAAVGSSADDAKREGT